MLDYILNQNQIADKVGISIARILFNTCNNSIYLFDNIKSI